MTIFGCSSTGPLKNQIIIPSNVTHYNISVYIRASAPNLQDAEIEFLLSNNVHKGKNSTRELKERDW